MRRREERGKRRDEQWEKRRRGKKVTGGREGILIHGRARLYFHLR